MLVFGVFVAFQAEVWIKFLFKTRPEFCCISINSQVHCVPPCSSRAGPWRVLMSVVPTPLTLLKRQVTGDFSVAAVLFKRVASGLGKLWRERRRSSERDSCSSWPLFFFFKPSDVHLLFCERAYKLFALLCPETLQRCPNGSRSVRKSTVSPFSFLASI